MVYAQAREERDKCFDIFSNLYTTHKLADKHSSFSQASRTADSHGYNTKSKRSDPLRRHLPPSNRQVRRKGPVGDGVDRKCHVGSDINDSCFIGTVGAL